MLNAKNQDAITPLNFAAQENQLEAATLLLGMGTDPLIGENENPSPIHLAAISGSIPTIVDLLIDHGVDINFYINLPINHYIIIRCSTLPVTNHMSF